MADLVDETAVLLLDQAEIFHELPAARREVGRAPALAARRPLHQRLARKVVHLVDGVPRRLVAHLHRLCRLGDRPMFGYLGQQFNAPRAAETLVPDGHPQRPFQFYSAPANHRLPPSPRMKEKTRVALSHSMHEILFCPRKCLRSFSCCLLLEGMLKP